jgi:hypothetical protein
VFVLFLDCVKQTVFDAIPPVTCFLRRYMNICRAFDGNGQCVKEMRIKRKQFDAATRVRVLTRTDGICYLCKDYLPEKGWHIEHVFAFSLNPADNDVLGNLLPSCAGCNLKKGTKCVLDCMTKDGFSLASGVPFSQLSLQPRVKRILLHALALKRRIRAAPAVPGLLPEDDDDLAQWCDVLEERSLRTALLRVDRGDIKEIKQIGTGGEGRVFSATLTVGKYAVNHTCSNSRNKRT